MATEIGSYVVQRGDNLTKIAKAHGMTGWRELFDLQGPSWKARDPNLIHVGERLRVPKAASSSPFEYSLDGPLGPASSGANPFVEQIALHDKSLHTLRMMRKLAAEHAAAIAQEVVTAGSHLGLGPSLSSLTDVFADHTKYAGAGKTVFDPWDGWWQGDWVTPGGKRYPQHHIWDKTRILSDKRWVQPVTQSEAEHKPADKLEWAWSGRTNVDIAINMWSEADGITGWVSKAQGAKREELPHVGYLYKKNVLIWFTRTNLLSANTYWIFIEHSDRPHYNIRGREFQIANGTVSNAKAIGHTQYADVTPATLP